MSEERAYALVDNRSAELAGWGFPELAATLKGLIGAGVDVTLLGWEPFEIEPLIQAEFPGNAEVSDGEGGEQAESSTVKFAEEEMPSVNEAMTLCRELARKPEWTDAQALTAICEHYIRVHTGAS